MGIDCRYCPLHKKDAFVTMTREELEFMQKFKVGELSVDPGTTILMQGSNSPQLYTVLSGMGRWIMVNGRSLTLSSPAISWGFRPVCLAKWVTA